jgi:LPXTG-motif cell wall-anchored protein
VPKTGDSAPLALWLGLVLAGIICLGTVIAQMRRSRKKEET